jgi:hypothetical protein
VLVQALDAFFSEWRESRCKINVNIKGKGTIKVSLDGAQWANKMAEIYAGSGRHYKFTSPTYPHGIYTSFVVLALSRMSHQQQNQ